MTSNVRVEVVERNADRDGLAPTGLVVEVNPCETVGTFTKKLHELIGARDPPRTIHSVTFGRCTFDDNVPFPDACGGGNVTCWLAKPAWSAAGKRFRVVDTGVGGMVNRYLVTYENDWRAGTSDWIHALGPSSYGSNSLAFSVAQIAAFPDYADEVLESCENPDLLDTAVAEANRMLKDIWANRAGVLFADLGRVVVPGMYVHDAAGRFLVDVRKTEKTSDAGMQFFKIRGTYATAFDRSHLIKRDHTLTTERYEGTRTLEQLGFCVVERGSDAFAEYVKRGMRTLIRAHCVIAEVPGYWRHPSKKRPVYFTGKCLCAIDPVRYHEEQGNSDKPTKVVDMEAVGGSPWKCDDREIENCDADTRSLLAIVSPMVDAFLFDEGEWATVDSSAATAAVYDKTLLDRLVLPPGPVSLMGGFVKQIHEGLPNGMRLLVSGPPGVGKTMLVHAVAAHEDVPVLWLDGRNTGTKVHEVAYEIRKWVQRSVRFRALLVIDEAEAMVGERTVAHSSYNACVAAFLRTIECSNCFAVLVTNYPERIDMAMRLRCTFDIAIRPPDYRQRKTLWRNAVAAHGGALTTDEVAKLARDGYTGREITQIVSAAVVWTEGGISKDAITTVAGLKHNTLANYTRDSAGA